MSDRSPRRRWIAAALASVTLVVVLGPRPAVDGTVRPVALPADLDAYVAEAEARFSDITPGAEKRIEWADSATRSRTPVSLVYLHGYSATRQETRPLIEDLASALGANAFLTRLAGHGRSQDAMAEATVNAWLNDAAEALAIGRALGERIVLIGTSTGATLALWAMAQEAWQDDVSASVLISPNFRPADPGSAILTWPWGGAIARLVVGPYREWEPVNDLQARFWTTRYPTLALLPMAALVQALRQTDLSSVAAPTLVLYSRLDEVISVPAVAAAAPTIGSTGALVVDVGPVGDPSHHVLAGDILSPDDTRRVAELILEFLRESLANGAEGVVP